MKQAAPPCWQIQHNAWLCAYVMLDYEMPAADRMQVQLVLRMHPENLGWLSVVRMFVLADLYGIQV